jgi:transcriptional regulator with XRE-family HTH domain
MRTGRITPSVDAIARLAQALDVSLDYLVVDDQPRRSLHVDDHGLTERLATFAELDGADRENLLSVLDALITRKRLCALANDAS